MTFRCDHCLYVWSMDGQPHCPQCAARNKPLADEYKRGVEDALSEVHPIDCYCNPQEEKGRVRKQLLGDKP
jgi:hypothetical protein